MMSVKLAAPRPNSAGITPELARISWMASTLKFENVAPPSSGSVDIDAVHGEDGGGAALAVDRELLREVCGAVGVGLRSGSEQQQLAEIALVERESGNSAAGKALAAGGRGIYALHVAMEHQLVLVRQIQRHFGVFTRLDNKRRRGTLGAFFPAHGNRVAAGGQAGELKFPLCIRGDGSQFAATLEHDGSSVDRMAGGVAQNALP